MKNTHKILIVLMLLLSNINFAQEFNGYKYIVISDLDYGVKGKDIYGISSSIANYFRTKGYNVIYGVEKSLYPSDLKFNNCLGLFVAPLNNDQEITLNFLNCKNESIKQLKESGWNGSSYGRALKRIFTQLDKNNIYSFNENLTPTINFPKVENINKDETQLKSYFDSTKLEPIEGIYKTYKSDSNYKLGLFKVGDLYKAIIIESDYPQWKKGDVKAIFESTAADGVFSAKWYKSDKTSLETFANLEGGLINIEIKNPNGENNDMKLLKLYPKN